MGNCAKCGVEKTKNNTHRNVSNKDDMSVYCKNCTCLLMKEYRKKHSMAIKEYRKKYQAKNKTAIKAYDRKRYAEKSETMKEYGRKYYTENKEARKEYHKKWRLNHKKQRNEYMRQRTNLNPKFKINEAISSNIRSSLKGKKAGRHWETFVDYTVDQLKRHLEKQFKDGMSWDNYGRNGWNIDHIIPVSVFNFSSPNDIDFKRCWALSNLQPMWARENIIKSNKLNKPFQPSLTIEGNK